MSIHTKLTVVTFALLVSALSLLALTTYRSTAGVIRDTQDDLIRNVLERTDNSLLLLQEQVNTLLLSVSADPRLWTAPPNEVEQILGQYLRFNSMVSSMYVRRAGGQLVAAAEFQHLVPVFSQDVAPVLEDYARRHPRGIWWTEPYKSPMSGWTVTVGMTASPAGGPNPGVIAADLSLQHITEILSRINKRETSTLLLVTEQGTPVVADPRSAIFRLDMAENRLLLPEEVLAFLPDMNVRTAVEVGRQTYRLMTGPGTKFGWHTAVLYSQAEMVRAELTVRRTSLWLLALIALLSLALAWFVARNFVRPLERLAGEMARVRHSQLQGIHLPDREDEIGQLARAFDDMMGRVRRLVQDLKETEARKKEVEIRSLQAQIRPHFLFNTLTVIGQAALLGRTSDVYDMVLSLTKFLSFSLDKVTEKVTLAEELEMLEHYIRLQQVRYGGLFDVSYDLALGTGGCEVLKLTLQPLVENAIFHGLTKRAEGAVLRLTARIVDETLVLEVADNGPGMLPEKLRALESGRAPARGAGGMGLRNVRERLDLHYGEAASLTVDSAAPVGTTIRISLPAVRRAAAAREGT